MIFQPLIYLYECFGWGFHEVFVSTSNPPPQCRAGLRALGVLLKPAHLGRLLGWKFFSNHIFLGSSECTGTRNSSPFLCPRLDNPRLCECGEWVPACPRVRKGACLHSLPVHRHSQSVDIQHLRRGCARRHEGLVRTPEAGFCYVVS